MRRTLLALAACTLLACDGPTASSDAGSDAGTDASSGACTFDPGPPETIDEPEVHTPRWAFEPWISKDISDREDSYAFVQGFLDRDLIERIHRHLGFGDVNARAVAFDPDLHVEIDNPLDRHQNLHRPSLEPSFGWIN